VRALGARDVDEPALVARPVDVDVRLRERRRRRVRRHRHGLAEVGPLAVRVGLAAHGVLLRRVVAPREVLARVEAEEHGGAGALVYVVVVELDAAQPGRVVLRSVHEVRRRLDDGAELQRELGHSPG